MRNVAGTPSVFFKLLRGNESAMLRGGRVPYDERRRTPSDPEGSSGSQISRALWSTRLFFEKLRGNAEAFHSCTQERVSV